MAHIEIRMAGARSDKDGKVRYWGNVCDGFDTRSTPRYLRARSALTHARTLAVNLNGDKSGGGRYQGKAAIAEIFHPSFQR